MKTKAFTLILASILASILLLTTGYALATNGSRSPSSPGAVLGNGITYQGYLEDGGTQASGSYDFYFELWDAASEGTSIMAITKGDVEVVDGLFAVLLDFGSNAFNGEARWLEISVRSGDETGPYTRLDDRQQITAAPYALYAVEADTVDGLHASELGNHYQNVVVVAKSGGDYTRVQTAIDSIADASDDNPYLVWVAPGVYSETVTMKPFVHLQGAGQQAVVITSMVSSNTYPPNKPTLIMASDTSLRDLTVSNSGGGEQNAALLATTGITRTVVANVAALARGSGENNYAIVLSANGTGLQLQQVSALSENGSNLNTGLLNHGGSVLVVRGGSFTGRGGTDAQGILSTSGSTIDAENVTALGENGTDGNYGLHTDDSGVVTLHGGTFTGRGGSFTTGINNWETTLLTEGVTALGENGSGSNVGLGNNLSDSVTLRSSSFIGRGGTNAYGIQILGMNFEAIFITALGENGSSGNYGFYHTDSASTDIQQSILSGATNAIKSNYGYFTVSNSRLVGGSVSVVNGAVTCVLVTRGTLVSTDGSTCP